MSVSGAAQRNTSADRKWAASFLRLLRAMFDCVLVKDSRLGAAQTRIKTENKKETDKCSKKVAYVKSQKQARCGATRLGPFSH